MLNKPLLWIVTGIFVSANILLIGYCLVDYSGLVLILERHLSLDGVIVNPKISIIKLFAIFCLLILLMWTAHWNLSVAKFMNLSRLLKTSFIIVIAAAVLFPVCRYQIGWLSEAICDLLLKEDGLFEILTAVFLLIAAVIVIRSMRTVDNLFCQCYRIFLIFILVVLAMEEISWGQRIFGLATPEYFMGMNSRGELNIHNFYTDGFHIFYPLANLVLAILLLCSDRIKHWTESRSMGITAVIPGSGVALFGIVFIFLCIHSLMYDNELTEFVFSVFMLGYSVELNLNSEEEFKK